MLDFNNALPQHHAPDAAARLSLDDVKEMLVDRMEELAHELLGAGNRALSSSHQLRVNRKGSIAVEFHGDRRGQWFDHENDAGGGPIELMQTEGIMVPISIAGSAVETVAFDRPFHPVREYLDELRWDGAPRVERWLSIYADAEDTEYTRAVGPRWLISAVARAYQPGCKADCMLILEGDQGINKSQLFAALGRPWFTDRISTLGSKDSAVEIAGVWIVELAELDSLMRSEASAIKAYLSTTEDRYRPPYGKRAIAQPRQCVFAGSVNPEDGYLKDNTGGRRFWPVKVPGRIDVDRITRDRDQLWAEAVRMYRAGCRWWLEDDQLEALARTEQDERRLSDAWESTVREYLVNEFSWTTPTFGPPQRYLTPRPAPLDEVTSEEIIRAAINKPIERVNAHDQKRVVGVLIALGFKRTRPRVPNAEKETRVCVYVRQTKVKRRLSGRNSH